VVENGNNIPLDEHLNEVPKSSWTDTKKKIFLPNSKACNALLYALLEEEYTKVHSFKSAK